MGKYWTQYRVYNFNSFSKIQIITIPMVGKNQEMDFA